MFDGVRGRRAPLLWSQNDMHLHIEFFVEDLARSRDFYRRVLGFRLLARRLKASPNCA
jgi:catechol-2,3-dioxygenase